MNTTFSRQVPGPTRQAEIDWPGQGVLTAPARRHPDGGGGHPEAGHERRIGCRHHRSWLQSTD